MIIIREKDSDTVLAAVTEFRLRRIARKNDIPFDLFVVKMLELVAEVHESSENEGE